MMGKLLITLIFLFSSVKLRVGGDFPHAWCRQIGERGVLAMDVPFSYHLLGAFLLLCGTENCLILIFSFWDICGDNLSAVNLVFVFCVGNEASQLASKPPFWNQKPHCIIPYSALLN